MGRDRRHVAQSQQKDADMIRVILWNLFLFLLPFMLTALWALWVRRTSPARRFYEAGRKQPLSGRFW